MSTQEVRSMFGTSVRVPMLIVVFAIEVLAVTSHAQAKDFGEPYVLKRGVYALDTTYDRGFRVSAYLPHTTLVFPVPGKVRKFKTFRALLVVTQFGQRVYVPEGEIAGKFKDVYGDQEFIFHSDKSMCPIYDRDCDDDSCIPVSRGDVAKILVENDQGYTKLRLYKKPPRDGCIKVSDLTKLLAQGWVTDTRKKYPKYEMLAHSVVSSMSTDCGTKRKTVSEKDVRAEIGAEISVSSILKAIFGVGGYVKGTAGTGKSWKLTKEFGSDKHAYQTSVLTIRDLDNKITLTYFVCAKYACVCAGPHKQKVFAEELTLFDDDSTLRGFFDFQQIYGWKGDLTARCEPYRVFSLNNRRPFFTSINSHGEYWRVFRRFYDELQSVGLAAILISEFNASCPRRKQQDGSFVPKLCREKLRAR